MADMFSRKKRSKIMSQIRSRGNAATELRFIHILRKHKISGWRRNSRLPGKPDFIFPAGHLAVFIDGDFWHGNPKRFRIPKSNVSYWQQKILSNVLRDKRTNKTLRKLGWRVFRFWQSSLNDENRIVARINRVKELQNVSC